MDYLKRKKIVKENKVIYKIAYFLREIMYKILSIVPDETYIKCQYRNQTGKKLNLDNPTLFNEKLQWIKLNYRNELMTTCADKYSVRQYVKNKVGDNILNELYGVYEKPEDINLNSLPDSFVLKMTHGWGDIIICKDKDELDWRKTQKVLKYNLSRSHYLSGREWAYKNIKPRIVCEKFISENGNPPKDYKIYCFNGEPKLIHLDVNRFTGLSRSIYDTEWNLLNFEFGRKQSTGIYEKPDNLDAMLDIAKKLSGEFPFVRVDLYNVNGHIIFGELTFYPLNGIGRFNPEEYNRVLGDYLELPSS